MEAVVFDLFGTLIDAPTPADRAQAASRLAKIIGCDSRAVENYFLVTWQVRHDGTLATVADVAAHLVHTAGGQSAAVEPATRELYALGSARLVPDTSVMQVLTALRRNGLRLGVLSDASPEIAAAWPASRFAVLVDTAVFSCETGCTKPDPRLYAHISNALGMPTQWMLYVGDGGGDELRGALGSGMTAVGVHRRGSAGALAFGNTPWPGPVIDTMEQVPTYLANLG